MANPIFKIEMVNMDRIDVALKGNQNEVIQMIYLAMEQYPEIREAIMYSAKNYLDKNRLVFPWPKK